MNENAQFIPIDPESLERKITYRYFSLLEPAGNALMTDVNISDTLHVLEPENIEFFPAFLWLITKHINSQRDFKMAKKDEQLGYFDVLTPIYPHAGKTGAESLIWTPYSDDFKTFYQSYQKDKEKFEAHPEAFTKDISIVPENTFGIYCVPQIPYDYTPIRVFEERTDYFPLVRIAKPLKKYGVLMLPVSITCHHTTTIESQLKEFLENSRDDLYHFQDFLG